MIARALELVAIVAGLVLFVAAGLELDRLNGTDPKPRPQFAAANQE